MNRSRIAGVRRWMFGLSAAAVVAVLAAATVCADPVKPTAEDRQISQSVATLLAKEHLSKHPIDDEISRRFLKAYLEALDSRKAYFYQSDIDGFHEMDNKLDDQIAVGDVSFAYEVFHVFLQRVDERVKLVDELLAMKHDFTVDEMIVKDPDLTTYPRTPEEARERWRKRVKYDLLVLKADGITGEKAIEKLKRRYHWFADRMHQTDDEELLQIYLTSMTTRFDPHTTYMSASTLENFRIIMRLNLEGIGAALRSEDGYTVVEKIIRGGAAHKDARLQVGDRIIGVGEGADGEIVDVVNDKLSDVVDRIRGHKGTVVRLKVVAEETEKNPDPQPRVIEITRAKIELKDSEARGEVFEEGHKADGSPYHVGVIALPSFYMDMEAAGRGDPFYKSTTRDCRKILDGFRDKGVDVVVLDLRRNGGGSLTEAIQLTALFIDEGPIVQTEDENGEVTYYAVRRPSGSSNRLIELRDAKGRILKIEGMAGEVAWDGPMVVLLSKFSASASEILAGAIQDYQRGLIVGDHTTHGKGTVQSLMDIGARMFRFTDNAPSLGALKITKQQFYRPGGDSTQVRGVLSDVELPSLTTHLDVGEADLEYPVKFDQVDPLDFKHFKLVDKPICRELAQLSRKRMEGSEDFQKLAKDIARFKELKDQKYVTLNEEKFLAQRKELDVDKAQEEQIEEMNDPDAPVIERDYYFNEAIAVTLDYLHLLNGGKAKLADRVD